MLLLLLFSFNSDTKTFIPWTTFSPAEVVATGDLETFGVLMMHESPMFPTLDVPLVQHTWDNLIFEAAIFQCIRGETYDSHRKVAKPFLLHLLVHPGKYYSHECHLLHRHGAHYLLRT